MPPVPLYLDGGVAAFHHAAAGRDPARPAVVLVPPFGWEDVASYRVRRAWAATLAGAGHPVVRLDLPGTGDSAGGPGDPDRVGAWTRAVDTAAAWLRASTGCRRVVAIGLGLGGVPAWLAAARGSHVDDVVLWTTPSRVRGLVREMRAFAALAATEWRDAPAPADAVGAPDGWLEVAGYTLSAETLEALSALELAGVPLADPARRRVLLIGRDGAAPDERLATALEAAGAQVRRRHGAGWAALVSGPQTAEYPEEVAAEVAAWLAEAPDAPGVVVPEPPPAAADALHLAEVRERPWVLDRPEGRLFGVLSEPAAVAEPRPLGLVLLNAGAVRHTGPNRMWVELGRAWAARGVPVLRLDIAGIGDAGGDPSPFADSRRLYDPRLSAQAADAVRELAVQGVASSFVVGGLCAGASWAFHALLADEPRVQAAVMINLFAFFYEEELVAEADVAAARRSRRAGSVARVLRGEVDAARLRRIAAHLARTPLDAHGRRRRRRRRAGRLDEAFDRIRDARLRMHLLLGIDEPAYATLEREGRLARLSEWPNLHLHRLPTRDHTFRAVWQQRRVRALLDEIVASELEQATAPVLAGRP